MKNNLIYTAIIIFVCIVIIWLAVLPSYSPFDGSSEYIYRCNQCGENNYRDSAFCPNCGAKMNGGVNDAAD